MKNLTIIVSRLLSIAPWPLAALLMPFALLKQSPEQGIQFNYDANGYEAAFPFLLCTNHEEDYNIAFEPIAENRYIDAGIESENEVNNINTGMGAPTPNTLSCALPAPSTFDGERTSGTTATVFWSTIPNAAGYRLIVRNLSTSEVVSDTIEYGTSKSLSGLQSGTSYSCVLASVCPDGFTSSFIIIIDAL